MVDNAGVMHIKRVDSFVNGKQFKKCKCKDVKQQWYPK